MAKPQIIKSPLSRVVGELRRGEGQQAVCARTQLFEKQMA
jgi:hypothetical protein